MTLVFFGTGEFGLPALDRLSKSPHRLLAVVTRPDKPSGRKLEQKPSAIKSWAAGRSVPVIEYSDNESEVMERLKALDADVFIVISFGKILKKPMLELPRKAAINVHGSLLPRWRGASPMQSSILAGDPETGVTVMRMVEALDAGDMLLSKKTPVGTRETILTLAPRLAALGADALEESLALLESGSARWTPQDAGSATVCVKILKENGRLDWYLPAVELDRRVRAYLEWPVAFTFLRGKRVLVRKCRAVSAGLGKKPGSVLDARDSGIVVAAGAGALAIEELQMEGRGALSAAEFLKGTPVSPADSFE